MSVLLVDSTLWKLYVIFYSLKYLISIFEYFFFLPQNILQTNTFQIVIVTDEVRTYAMFNYAHLGWSTHAEAGGDTNTGQGGVPAFVS